MRYRNLMLLPLVLYMCGCSAVQQPEQLAAGVREQYTAAQSIELLAQITSDLGEQTQTYEISYSYQNTEDSPTAVMTVRAPESIAGITATVTGADYMFSYADTELETAMPDRKGLTPADVLTYLLDDLMHSEPEQIWKEGENLGMRYEMTGEEGSVVKEVYVSADTGALCAARIYSNGKQILQCAFSTCTLGK